MDGQFNEILSVKSELSSIFIKDENDTEICGAKEMKDLEVNSEELKNPMALLIIASNVNGIKEDTLSSDGHVIKVTTFTLGETKNVTINSSCLTDVVVLRPLTNDFFKY